MRRVIKIGVLLMLAVLVVRFGIALAQAPANPASVPTAPAKSDPTVVPSPNVVSSPAPAVPSANKSKTKPFAQLPGARFFAAPPGVPAPPNVSLPPELPPSAPASRTPVTSDFAPAAAGTNPLIAYPAGPDDGAAMMGDMGTGGMTRGPAGIMMSGPPRTDSLVSGSMPGMATVRVPVYGVPISPELQRLNAELRRAQQEEQVSLAAYAAAANDHERTKIKAGISKILERQFDLQQQMRKLELDPIEARVKRLRELIDKRNQARKTIVEKRLDQLLRDAEGLGWTPPNEPAATVVVPARTATVASTSSRPGWQWSPRGDANPLRASAGSGRYTTSAANVPSPAKVAVPVVEGLVVTEPASGQIEISLGADMGIGKGHSLEVYRTGPGGTAYVGRVVVSETKPDRAVCRIVPEFQKNPILKGDRVTTKPLLYRPLDVAKPTQAGDAANGTQLKIFSLVHADASALAELLSVLPAVSEKRVQITADKRTNSLVANGPERDLSVIEALLLRLDAAETIKAKKTEDRKTGTKR